MGDVVNLRLARKRRARDLKQAEASENRIRFGRTRDEQKRQRADVDRTNLHLDGHRLEPDDLGQDPNARQ